MTDATVLTRQEGTGGRARVAIVDDHAMVAESVAMALCRSGIDATCVDGLADDIVERILHLAPELALLDLVLGESGRSGVDLIAPLRAADIQVLMVTGVGERRRHAECLAAGATGVLDKTASLDHVVGVVTAALDGRPPISAAERTRMLAELDQWRLATGALSARLETLSRREIEVLRSLVRGCTASVIAEQDFVSLATVRAQIRSILRKLGVHSQIEAVALAVRAGWA